MAGIVTRSNYKHISKILTGKSYIEGLYYKKKNIIEDKLVDRKIKDVASKKQQLEK